MCKIKIKGTFTVSTVYSFMVKSYRVGWSWWRVGWVAHVILVLAQVRRILTFDFGLGLDNINIYGIEFVFQF